MRKITPLLKPVLLLVVTVGLAFLFTPRINRAIEWIWETVTVPQEYITDPATFRDTVMIYNPSSRTYQGWIVGEPHGPAKTETTLMRYSANKWSDASTDFNSDISLPGGTTVTLTDIDGLYYAGEFRVVAVGKKTVGGVDQGVLYYHDGSTWYDRTPGFEQPSPPPLPPFNAVSIAVNANGTPADTTDDNLFIFLGGEDTGTRNNIWRKKTTRAGGFGNDAPYSADWTQIDTNHMSPANGLIDITALSSISYADTVYTYAASKIGNASRLYRHLNTDWAQELSVNNADVNDIAMVAGKNSGGSSVFYGHAVGAINGVASAWMRSNALIWRTDVESLPGSPALPPLQNVTGVYDDTLREFDFWAVGNTDSDGNANTTNDTDNAAVIFSFNDGSAVSASWARQDSRTGPKNLMGIDAGSRIKVVGVGSNNALIMNSPGNIFGWGWFGAGSTHPWWNSNYGLRQRLTVSAGSTAIAAGNTITVRVNLIELFLANKVQSDFDDIRVVYTNNITTTELDREILAPGLYGQYDIRFKAQDSIGANASDGSYYLYYKNPSAGTPPVNAANVYQYYEGFGTDPGWVANNGTCNATTSVSGGRLRKTGPTINTDCFRYDGNDTFDTTKNWFMEATLQRNSGNLASIGLRDFSGSVVGGWYINSDGSDSNVKIWSSSGGFQTGSTYALVNGSPYRFTLHFQRLANWEPTCGSDTGWASLTGYINGLEQVQHNDWQGNVCGEFWSPMVHTWSDATAEWDDVKIWQSLGETVAAGPETSYFATTVGDSIGWVSLNCADRGICETSNFSYGVNISPTGFDAGRLSGYAWLGDGDVNQYRTGDCQAGLCQSDTSKICITDYDCRCSQNPAVCKSTGWISLNRSDTGTPPAAPFNGSQPHIAFYDQSNRTISGWARMLAFAPGGTGWIKLRGASVTPPSGTYSLCGDCDQATSTCKICDQAPGGRNYSCRTCTSCNLNTETCGACSACDQYGVSINEATGKISGFGWSQNYGWLDFTHANYYSTAWIQTRFGDIYSRSDIGSGTTPSAPGITQSNPNASLCNATYLIQARGTITNFCADVSVFPQTPKPVIDPLRSGPAADDFGFPDKSTQYTSSLGSIDFNKITTLAAGTEVFNGPCPVGDCNLQIGQNAYGDLLYRYTAQNSGKYYIGGYEFDGGPLVNPAIIACGGAGQSITLNNAVYYFDGDFIVNSAPSSCPTLKFNNGNSTTSGTGMFIAKGKIVVDKPIAYDTSTGFNQLSELASAVLMSTESCVVFTENSSSVVGSYYAGGTCVWPEGGGKTAGLHIQNTLTESPFELHGLLIAKSFNFGRTYRGTVLNPQPAEKIFYDGRLIVNPPRGLQDFSLGFPSLRQISP